MIAVVKNVDYRSQNFLYRPYSADPFHLFYGSGFNLQNAGYSTLINMCLLIK